MIVSLAEDEPVVRAWRIADGRVEEEEVVVTGEPSLGCPSCGTAGAGR